MNTGEEHEDGTGRRTSCWELAFKQNHDRGAVMNQLHADIDEHPTQVIVQDSYPCDPWNGGYCLHLFKDGSVFSCGSYSEVSHARVLELAGDKPEAIEWLAKHQPPAGTA